MTSIERIGGPAAIRTGGRAPASGGTGFMMPVESAAKTHATSTVTPLASLSSMLTLQELGGETPEDRRARGHGQDMLVLLGRLQRALLSGRDDATTLAQLAELAAAVPQAIDRRLAAILSAIVVRARVELARRQV